MDRIDRIKPIQQNDWGHTVAMYRQEMAYINLLQNIEIKTGYRILSCPSC
jgi:hypothetical protein